jgi:CRISPR/Cas system CMR subunit Cmr6 (Cas7 group RAMP superfamily)
LGYLPAEDSPLKSVLPWQVSSQNSTFLQEGQPAKLDLPRPFFFLTLKKKITTTTTINYNRMNVTLLLLGQLRKR